MTGPGSPLSRLRIGVVGAHGAVGEEVLRILTEKGVPADRIRAFVSERRAGEPVVVGEGSIAVESRTLSSTGSEQDFHGLDGVVFAADAETARLHAPHAVRAGAVVVDNSSAFRCDRSIPLAIPEVARSLDAEPGSARLFANPNCSTILAALALEPLRAAFGLRSVSIVTYQAVSGAGRAALDELLAQTRDVLDGRAPKASVLPEPIAFNVFPHESPIDPDTMACEEELKILRELRRILGAPDLPIDPFCVRVPVERCHSQAIRVELDQAATLTEVEATLAAAPGLELDREHTPTPLRAQHRDEVLVGRVRPCLDASVVADRTNAFRLWLSGDQLRKGAALNALQVLESVAR